MTRKQYEAAQIIMQMSRTFSRAMYECMQNAGLLDEGYVLDVNVRKPYEVIKGTYLRCAVELCQDVSIKEWLDNRMCVHDYVKEGWVVIDDPVVRSGCVPPDVRTADTAAEVYRAGKTAEKPFAPDGLWLSRYDDPCDVGGGV